MPWRFRGETSPISQVLIGFSVFLFLLGILMDVTFLLGSGWTVLLWSWLSSRITPESKGRVIKLLVLSLMAFPWVSLDGDRLGWWFRISGAWTTAQIFVLMGFDVVHAGTSIIINNLRISVEAACSGLNSLQSMLIAGSLPAYLLLKDTPRFWWNLPMLILMAWVANTLRIITISTAALTVSPTFAIGAFHSWGGCLILLFMFGMCWLLFSLQEPKPVKPNRTPS